MVTSQLLRDPELRTLPNGVCVCVGGCPVYSSRSSEGAGAQRAALPSRSFSLRKRTPGPAIVLPQRRGPRVTARTSSSPHSPPTSFLTPPKGGLRWGEIWGCSLTPEALVWKITGSSILVIFFVVSPSAKAFPGVSPQPRFLVPAACSETLYLNSGVGTPDNCL